jgi:hypothetical protein
MAWPSWATGAVSLAIILFVGIMTIAVLIIFLNVETPTLVMHLFIFAGALPIMTPHVNLIWTMAIVVLVILAGDTATMVLFPILHARSAVRSKHIFIAQTTMLSMPTIFLKSGPTMRPTLHRLLFNSGNPDGSQIPLKSTKNDLKASLHAENAVNTTFPFVFSHFTSKSRALVFLPTATGRILN